jgi:type IV secretory pathway VirJ component
LETYTYPLLVGDGAGATFAYAVLAQAPAGTFEGLFTLGWDSTLRFPKSICPGDIGAVTAAASGGSFRVVPIAKPPSPWWPLPFASDAPINGLGGLFAQAWHRFGLLRPSFASGDSATVLGAAYARWRRSEDSVVALPDDVADLPLTDIAPIGARKPGTPPRIAIIITGDGGWAGLDRGVADALTAQGIRVIGFSTLKFFWHKQTPAAIAEAITRVIAHYGKDDADARFVLIGYSFGASLVPIAINRLPAAARRRVDGGVMISPDDTAVFEIHVGDWFGSTRHDEALPLAPELAASKAPLLCVHGIDENDSFCLKAPQRGLSLVQLPGGHHYTGDYAALGAAIVNHLPVAPVREP